MRFKNMTGKSMYAELSFRAHMTHGILCIVLLASQAFSVGGPGEYSTETRWRDLLVSFSPTINPALISQADNYSFYSATALTMNNAFNLGEIGLILPSPFSSRVRQAIAVSYMAEYSGSFTQYSYNSSNTPISTGTTVSHLKHIGTLSWGANVWKILSFGVNASITSHSNFGEQMNDGSIDVGINAAFPNSNMLGRHSVGISIANVTGLFGTSRYNVSMFSPTARAIYSVSRDFGGNLRVNAGANAHIQDISIALDSEHKISPYIEKKLGFIAGIDFFEYISTSFLIGTGYIGGATTVNIPYRKSLRNISAGYQFTATEDQVAPSHTIYLKADILSRDSLAVLIEGRTPWNMYNEAMSLYSSGKYWEAFLRFGELLTHYPGFPKNPEVKYYSGSCLEHLQVHQAALRFYRQSKADCGRSITCMENQFGAKADLGMMRIYYRDSHFGDVMKQFEKLESENVSDSIRDHGAYLKGQIHYQMQEYDSAIYYLSGVSQNHPDYSFARFTNAICHHELGHPQRTVVQSFNDCIGNRNYPDSKSNQYVIDNGRLMLAMLYAEESQFREMSEVLRAFPEKSAFYHDALLLYAWCAAKIGQWEVAAKVSGNLVNTADDILIQAEAWYIKGMALFNSGKYEMSIKDLEKAEDLLKAFSVPPADSISVRETEHFAIKNTLNSDFANTLIRFSATPISRKTPHAKSDSSRASYSRDQYKGIADSLHSIYSSFRGHLDEDRLYFDWYEVESRKTQRIQEVREDVQMAIAKADLVRLRKRSRDGKYMSDYRKMQNVDEQILQMEKALESIEKGNESEKQPDFMSKGLYDEDSNAKRKRKSSSGMNVEEIRSEMERLRKMLDDANQSGTGNGQGIDSE
jgi:tetratricopeptide (TPR) repeat protein